MIYGRKLLYGGSLFTLGFLCCLTAERGNWIACGIAAVGGLIWSTTISHQDM